MFSSTMYRMNRVSSSVYSDTHVFNISTFLLRLISN